MPKKINFFDRLRSRHDGGSFYDYSLTTYRTIEGKINIICPIHSLFQQRAGDHRRGSGCPKCGRENAKLTNLERYGTENPAKSPIIKKKIRDIFIDKYGVDNPSKDSNIKNKKSRPLYEIMG